MLQGTVGVAPHDLIAWRPVPVTTRIGCVTLIVILVLAGCSANPSPVVTSTVAPQSTIAATPTPVPTHSVVPVPTATPAGTPASGSPNSYLTTWPLPPACPTIASGAPVCAVNVPGAGTSQQASASDYLLIRAGWGDPTKQSCAQFASNASITITIDGHAEATTNLSCQLVGNSGQGGCTNLWRFDTRYLSPPLTSGTYTVTATFTYSGPVSGVPSGCTPGAEITIPAGTVQTFQKTVIVQ